MGRYDVGRPRVMDRISAMNAVDRMAGKNAELIREFDETNYHLFKYTNDLKKIQEGVQKSPQNSNLKRTRQKLLSRIEHQVMAASSIFHAVSDKRRINKEDRPYQVLWAYKKYLRPDAFKEIFG